MRRRSHETTGPRNHETTKEKDIYIVFVFSWLAVFRRRPFRGSEQEFHRELYLSRRSRIAGREARVADHAERRAADRRHASRLTEVRLVEQVEELQPQLGACAANERHVLDERQVRIPESRPDDRVPREVA